MDRETVNTHGRWKAAGGVIAFSREFAMPTPETFAMLPVSRLLDRWLQEASVVVDPFAGNATRGTLTNDLSLATNAASHLPADVFLQSLNGTEADVVLFDPPYSPRQIKECYASIGLECSQQDTQNARLYRVVKDGLARVLRPGGIAILLWLEFARVRT